MNRIEKIIFILVMCVCTLPIQALAGVPAGAVPSYQGIMFETSSNGVSYLCFRDNNGITTAGKIVSGSYFISFKNLAKNSKKAMKKASGKKLASLTKKQKNFSRQSKSGNTACTNFLVATPTPTPGFGNGNFDLNGNTTPAGNTKFSIPSYLVGNISIGRALIGSYCTCHEERLNWSFPDLRASIVQSPMLFTTDEIDDQMLADITAALNRYR